MFTTCENVAYKYSPIQSSIYFHSSMSKNFKAEENSSKDEKGFLDDLQKGLKILQNNDNKVVVLN